MVCSSPAGLHTWYLECNNQRGMQEFGISAGVQMCCRLQLGELLSKSEKTTTAAPDFKHANILLPCVAIAEKRDEMENAKVSPECENGWAEKWRLKWRANGNGCHFNFCFSVFRILNILNLKNVIHILPSWNLKCVQNQFPISLDRNRKRAAESKICKIHRCRRKAGRVEEMWAYLLLMLALMLK